MGNSIKKIILPLILISLLVFPFVAGAQDQDAVTKLINILKAIANIMRAILIVVAIIFVLVAAFYFVIARGEEEKLRTARTMLLWSLIGVAVGIAAPLLVDFALDLVGVGPVQ